MQTIDLEQYLLDMQTSDGVISAQTQHIKLDGYSNFTVLPLGLYTKFSEDSDGELTQLTYVICYLTKLFTMNTCDFSEDELGFKTVARGLSKGEMSFDLEYTFNCHNLIMIPTNNLRYMKEFDTLVYQKDTVDNIVKGMHTKRIKDNLYFTPIILGKSNVHVCLQEFLPKSGSRVLTTLYKNHTVDVHLDLWDYYTLDMSTKVLKQYKTDTFITSMYLSAVKYAELEYEINRIKDIIPNSQNITWFDLGDTADFYPETYLQSLSDTEEQTKILNNVTYAKQQYPNLLEDVSIEHLTKQITADITRQHNKEFMHMDTNYTDIGLTEKQVKIMSMIEDIIEKSKDKRKKTVAQLLKMSHSNRTTDEYTINLMSSILTTQNNYSNGGLTSKQLIKKYLEQNGITKAKNTKELYDTLFADYTDILTNIVYNQEITEALYDQNEIDVINKIFVDTEYFYAGIFAIITGTPVETMQRLKFVCEQYDLQLSVVLNTNPYLLNYIAFDVVTAKRIEIFAQFVGLETDDNLNDSRCINYLGQSTILESSSTIFGIDELNKTSLGVIFTQAQYERLRTTGSVLTQNQRINAKNFLGNNSVASYPLNQIKTNGYTYSYMPVGLSKENIMLHCIESGFITKLGATIYSVTAVLEKEYFILKTMTTLMSRTYKYSPIKIAKIVSEYEASLPFELEDDQRNAANLISYGAACVSGVAGSGKTTLIKLFIKLLEALEPNTKIVYVAPTGRAAKRMREVLGVDAKTIHRHFKIGVGKENSIGFGKDKSKYTPKQQNCILIMDEAAMNNIDVLYEVLLRLNIEDENTRIYMFGDIHQLPPIGKGAPFRDLLFFLPRVQFNKCKRTGLKSNITSSATKFIEPQFVPIESKNDFYLLDTPNNNISATIEQLCAYYLGSASPRVKDYLESTFNIELPNIDGLTADDIQIVSPVSKAKYSWSTTCLNQRLKPIFNQKANSNNTFACKSGVFAQPIYLTTGDRVMHVKANLYNRLHYTRDSAGYTAICDDDEIGVFNGELGKIIEIVPTDAIRLTIDSELPNNVVDDTTWVGSNHYFVVVKFYDDIKDEDYYILYHAETYTEMEDTTAKYGLIGEDLEYLDLAYAATVHKCQGSQQRLIIFALDSLPGMNYNTFLSNELFYTGITRGEDLVFVIGSLGGKNQPLLHKIHDIFAINSINTLGLKLNNA